MKNLFSCLVAGFLALSAGAQNNHIFYGGSGDGESRAVFLPPTTNINDGGTGDGWRVAGFLPFVININDGGTGDGWALSHFLPQVVNINGGGNGDGWNFSSVLQPTINPNTGGNGDGWHFNTVLQPTLNMNLGGIGDGWSSTYTAVLPLPLSFIKFTAFKQEQTAILNWEMAKDDDVSYFDVERSRDAVSFTAIGQVVQDVAAHLKYKFVDEHPMQGKNYYRIRIQGINGSTAYTPARVVSFDGPANSAALKAYPVPAHDFITIEFPPQYLGHNTALNIYSVSGVIVRQMKLMPLKGTLMDLNIQELTDGSYYIHVVSGDEGASVKFIKLSK